MSEPVNVPNKNSKNMFKILMSRLDDEDQKINSLDKRKMDKPDPKTSVTNKDLFNIIRDDEERTNKRFDSVNKRFDDINKHFDGVNGKFYGINKRFDHMMYAQIGTIITILITLMAYLLKVKL